MRDLGVLDCPSDKPSRPIRLPVQLIADISVLVLMSHGKWQETEVQKSQSSFYVLQKVSPSHDVSTGDHSRVDFSKGKISLLRIFVTVLEIKNMDQYRPQKSSNCKNNIFEDVTFGVRKLCVRHFFTSLWHFTDFQINHIMKTTVSCSPANSNLPCHYTL